MNNANPSWSEIRLSESNGSIVRCLGLAGGVGYKNITF